jgi:hypothetical protein
MKPIVVLFLITLITGCGPQKPAETSTPAVPQGADIVASDSITQTFTLPDSINTGLIIATYVEIDPESHTLIMYARPDKKSAIHIRYLNDGKVLTEKLVVVSETLFRTKTGNEFNITDTTVQYKEGSQIRDHFRTDANN